MIDEIDSALDAWLTSAVAPTAITVSFGPPPDGAPSARRATVSAVLHDIVEDESARRADVDDIRGDDGHVIARQGAPRRFTFSYLVSVAAADVAQEHRLLGRVLQASVDSDYLPEEQLPERLRESGLGVRVRVAHPQAAVASPAADWRVAHMDWRTSIVVALDVPVVPTPVTEIVRPADKLQLDIARGFAVRTRSGGALDAERRWTSVRRREIRSDHT